MLEFDDNLVLLEDDEDQANVEPIMIEDDQFSIEPTDDREDILKIFSALATKASLQLKEDCTTNRRYARRLLISNQNCLVKSPNANNHNNNHGNFNDTCAQSNNSSQSSGLSQKTNSMSISSKKLKRGKREEIEVFLPIQETCWNDMDESDILLCLLCTIESEACKIEHWYNVRIHLDQFISEETKLMIDQEEQREYENLNEEEEDEEDDEEERAKNEEKTRAKVLVRNESSTQDLLDPFLPKDFHLIAESFSKHELDKNTIEEDKTYSVNEGKRKLDEQNYLNQTQSEKPKLKIPNGNKEHESHSHEKQQSQQQPQLELDQPVVEDDDDDICIVYEKIT